MSYFKGPEITTALPHFQPNTSILKILEETLCSSSDATAMVEGETGKTISCINLLQQSTVIAAGLQRRGVTVGDVVVMCCDKSILAFTIELGSMFTGATTVLLPTGSANRIDPLTRGHTVKAVFCDAEYADSVTKNISHMTPLPPLVAIVTPEDQHIAELMTSSTEKFSVFEVEDIKKHIPLVLFSSGTTGEPKAITMTDIGIQLTTAYFNHHFKSFMNPSLFYWYSSLLLFFCSICNKYPLIITNSKDTKDHLEMIDKYQVEAIFTNPGNMIRYINEPSLHQFDLLSLQRVFVGGDVIFTSVIEPYVTKVLKQRIKPEVLYASTEVGMLTTFKREHNFSKGSFGLCGIVNPGVHIKIVDNADNVVSLGCMGEVRIKSLAMSLGYWSLPELNSQLFDSDGFLRVGDAGFFDKKGNLYIRGRICDIITFKGVKFAPAELEEILLSHPSVLETAVVAKPHPSDKEHATAYVVRKLGTDVTETELEAFVNSQVDDTKHLKGGVHFLAALPRVVTGKVIRKVLREL